MLEQVSAVDGGVAIGDLNMALTFEWREHREQVGRNATLVVIVAPCGRAGFVSLEAEYHDLHNWVVPWQNRDRFPRLRRSGHFRRHKRKEEGCAKV